MPERRDSVDSFDDFFGVPKTENNDRKKSPVKPKENESIVATIVKTQPVVKRPQTPSTPEERLPSTPRAKPKISHSRVSSASSGNRNASPVISNRVESVHSKNYESDFDEEYDNAFEDDQTPAESSDDRTKHSSLPPPKQRSSGLTRRGSDSELKKSYTVAPRPKPKPEPVNRRKENLLPYIRPQQTRQISYPVRRRKDIISTSAKNDTEQRALSAKHDKLRSLEARIAELRRELESQRIENSTLRTIQRREEKAIKKYEEKEYDIHRIVRDYINQIDHIKDALTNERGTKQRLEKQIEVREEKLRGQTERLKKYEKIVQEKHLDERYELQGKLKEADTKLQTYQEKLVHHEKFIETLEKNHRYEINQELSKQRDLKRQLEARSEKYKDLQLKLEDNTRQIDTMHIYVQRTNKHTSHSPTNLSKSRSLQSLQDNSPRVKEKPNDSEKKRREQERKSRLKQQPLANESSSKKESNDENGRGHLPPKGKPPVRRLSTPRSIDEVEDDETLFGSAPKKLPPPPTTTTMIQKNEQHISQAQIHKRSVPPSTSTTESKNNSSGAGGSSTTPSSIFKLTEPPAASKSRATRDLDEKWSDMFGNNKQEDSAKEDLLAKLVADEQKERRMAAAAPPPPPSSTQRPSMTTFESSTRSITTTTKPSADPFESLFSNNSNKPTASRTNDLDDIFSTKPSSQLTTQTKNDPFESLFGPATTTNNSRQYSSQNDKLQRPKVIQNPRVIPNRTTVDEVEEFIL